MRQSANLSLLTAALLFFAGCGDSGDDKKGSQNAFSTKELLGEALFFDANLSFHRTQSCASCHNPTHAFVDDRDNGFTAYAAAGVAAPVSLGDMGENELRDDNLGDRNAPTAAYAMFSPEFTTYTDIYDNTQYKGGQFHDGREPDLKGQAGGPPLNPVEMGMDSKGAVVERIKENSGYVGAFKSLYGSDVFDDNDTAYAAMAQAIGKFEKTDTFAPFDSKWDRFLACKADGGRESECLKPDTDNPDSSENWTMQEVTGRDLFFSLNNTNCANCHTLASNSTEVEKETFTNYEFHNLGVPSNPDILAHMGDAFIDEGLYNNPDVNDTAQRGKFKVPTLRNVAVTAPYMHNGVFKSLETVIKFYEFRRDPTTYPTNPETGEAWDAAEISDTIDTTHLPSGSALSEAKIAALVAFLKTLTDKRYEHLLEE